MQPMPFSVGSGMWTDPRHFGYLTKASFSQGTTTVTTKRGAMTSAYYGTPFGSYSGDFVKDVVVFGLFATASAGAVTRSKRSVLDTNGEQFPGTPATVAVSIDGASWFQFTWQTDPEAQFNDGYWWANGDGNGGDPFNLYSVADDTELKVLVAIPH